MTAFQIAALLTPAIVGLVLLAMAVIVRRQNALPHRPLRSPHNLGVAGLAASTSSDSYGRKPTHAIPENLEHALAALRDGIGASSPRTGDASVEMGTLSDDIHRKLDIITDLVQSKAKAR